jgi:putative FmdB family regulatory protein
MPTYEYRCPQGHDFEKFFSRISESTSELECPECGQTAVRLISGGGGLLFKGSGFYLTDYGRNAHRTAAPDKKESGTAKESSGGDKRGGDSGSGSGSGGSGGMKAGEAGSGGGSGGTEKSSGKTGGDKASSGGGGSTGGKKE